MPARTGKTLSPKELAAWRGFLRVQSGIVKELDAEMQAEHGLPLSSYEVLLFLATSPDGEMRMSELASGVLLSKSGLTRLVDRLERLGYVQRRAATSDARGAYAVITDRGREWFEKARVTHLRGVRERFSDRFSDAELEQMAAFWDRVLPGASR